MVYKILGGFFIGVLDVDLCYLCDLCYVLYEDYFDDVVLCLVDVVVIVGSDCVWCICDVVEVVLLDIILFGIDE